MTTTLHDAYEHLKDTPLLTAINENAFIHLMECFDAVIKDYAEGESITTKNTTQSQMLLVARGAVVLIQEDYFGHTSLLRVKNTGDLALAGPRFMIPGLQYSIRAFHPSSIIILNHDKLTRPCNMLCLEHTQLLGNFVNVLIAGHQHNVGHIKHLSQRTCREKLLSYLSSVALQKDSTVFDIPFSRQELADYLCVDRSNMCTELTRMKKQGLIHTRGKHFELLEAFSDALHS